MSSKCPARCPQPLPTPQSCSSQFGTLDGVKEKNGSFKQHSAQLGKVGTHSRTPYGRNHGPGWFPWHWAMPPGKGVTQVKSSYSSYSLQWSKLIIFFLQRCVATCPLENWTCTKVLLDMGNYLRLCSPRASGPWPKGTGTSSWATAGSTAETKICLLITWCRDGWYLFLSPLAYSAQSHSSLKGTFAHE